jgi:PiT family inorganic phosphate transporter
VLAGGDGLVLVLAALLGAMMWNLITWYLTIPSSSSHALIGGVIGATIVASGTGAVNIHNLVQSVLVPAILSPFICGVVALLGTFAAYRLIRMLRKGEAVKGYRLGQVGSAALVSLAHGTNDAQKTMGVISLALIAHGDISAAHFYVPVWVKFGCALAIALGTATGGWRIINTMGNRLTDIESPQGFAAESLQRGGDPGVLLLRLPALNDAGRLRWRDRRWARQAPRERALGRRRANGHGVDLHDPPRGLAGGRCLGDLRPV